MWQLSEKDGGTDVRRGRRVSAADVCRTRAQAADTEAHRTRARKRVRDAPTRHAAAVLTGDDRDILVNRHLKPPLAHLKLLIPLHYVADAD